MIAEELQAENERLKKLLAESRNELAESRTELRRTHAQHDAVADQFTETLDEKNHRIVSLEHQIKLLLQRVYGSRQERINPNQLLLFSLEELQEIAEQLQQGEPEDDLIDDAPQGKRRRSRGRVGKLPEHLPREIIRHELSEDERACPCCGEPRDEFGVASSEQLELIPARLKVTQHDRVKYACRACEEQVTIADKPPQPIEKGLPAPGLCAHTVLSKFGDHQPLYRQ
ncbi:MAG: IS66 family transposase zinc-finger binding domain-containing protein, partial [Planctomycetales bacterium]